jgi:hypothetical protein
MGNQKSPRAGGGKLVRTEIVTVRFDPKLRYLAELAARKQRRTVSSFIEWAVEDALTRVVLLYDFGPGATDRTVASETEKLWDVDEADRFLKLAMSYPDLLTHDEQVLWKLVRENGLYPAADPDESGEVPDLRRLRNCWETLKKIAAGELPRSALPAAKSQSKKHPKLEAKKDG